MVDQLYHIAILKDIVIQNNNPLTTPAGHIVVCHSLDPEEVSCIIKNFR